MGGKPGLMAVETALVELLDSAGAPPDAETVPLSTARGRVLAEQVCSGVDVPPADNSAVDGYCLDHRYFQPGQRLPVSQRIPAGLAPTNLAPHTVGRIFTGAEVPAGADAVVMQEDSEATDDGVLLQQAPRAGQNIRPRGQDIRKGQTVLAQGTRLRAQELGLLASVGVDKVRVYRPLRVAILATGDELVEPGDSLGPGQIYNSNRYTLIGLLQGLGLDILDLGVVPDELEATEAALIKAAAEADVVLSSGGVSVGEEDHVRVLLERMGELRFWRLAIKPGKPFTCGQILGTPFAGLPANPAAVFVTFLVLCRPWLLKMQGASAQRPDLLRVVAGFSLDRAGVRQQYLRARLVATDSGPVAEIYPNQSSGILYSASWGNGMVVIPPGVTVSEGDTVDFLLYEQMLY